MKGPFALCPIALIAAGVFLAGCSEESFQTYTVPNEVVLQDPVVDPGNLSVTLSAIYNGEDAGIADAWFSVGVAGQETETPSYQRLDCSWENGKATAVTSGLSIGTDYVFNFVIETVGHNTVTAGKDKSLPFSLPHDFTFSTTNTVTAKVLQIAYKGADAFIREAELILYNSEGERMQQVPAAVCSGGAARALFKLEEWEEDLYSCTLDLTLFDQSRISSPEGKISLLPLPETLTQGAVEIDYEAGTFSFSAAYDGEDKTIEQAVFVLADKAGNVLETLTGDYGGRKVAASVSGYDYGRYYVTCILSLVDGSELSDGPLTFVYARPRAYETLVLEPVPMSAAGLAVKTQETDDKFSYLGYEWEYQYIYARTSSGKTTLYVSSKTPGYFQNATPFVNGIKTVVINHASGKDAGKFLCKVKRDLADEWTQLPTPSTGTADNKYAHVFDASGDVYCYFRIETTTQELKANGLAVEYYTEAPDEY